MAFRPSVAVFGACVLYPFHLRNIVVQAAVDRLVEARWTDEIHDEWIRNLAADVPGIPVARLQMARKLIRSAQKKNFVNVRVKIVGLCFEPSKGHNADAGMIEARTLSA